MFRPREFAGELSSWSCWASVIFLVLGSFGLVLVSYGQTHGLGLADLPSWLPSTTSHNCQSMTGTYDTLTPFYTRPKRKETLTFLINVNNFSKGYSRSPWLTRTLPMPPMSTSTAQVISYSESSNSWRADILNFLKVTRILFFKGLPYLQESLMKHGSTPTLHCKYSAGICQRLSNILKHLDIAKQFKTLNCPLFRTICYWPPVKECSRSSSRRSLSTTRWW